MQVIPRMSTYYPGSTPQRPQPLTDFVRDRGRDDNLRPIAEWLSTVNLSQQRHLGTIRSRRSAAHRQVDQGDLHRIRPAASALSSRTT
jgi:hypothetical protein